MYNIDKKIEDRVYDKIIGNDQLQIFKQTKAYIARNEEEVPEESNEDDRDID